MKKIITLAAIFASTPTLVFSAVSKDVASSNEVVAKSVNKIESPTTKANKNEPLTAVPVKRDQSIHQAAQEKHTQETQANYVEKLQKRIDEVKAFVEKNKSSVPALQVEQALMKIGVAEEWLNAIKSYKDPVTRYVRSFNYGMSEVASAEKDMKVHKAKKEVSEEVVKKGLSTLSKQSDSLLAEKKDITLHAENDTCFNTMLKSSLAYINLATKADAKPNFKHLTKRARRYLNDARKFLKVHKSRSSKQEKQDKKDVKVEKAAVPASLGSFAPLASK